MPIGVIDSGVGGFSILAHLEREFPEARFVYLSDTKNFPYSEKSVAKLQTLAEQHITLLQQLSCNPIVIACNTLTVSALAHLRETFPQNTFIGTVPAVKPASELLAPHSTVVVLATKNTAESEYLQNLIAPFRHTTNFKILGSTVLVEAIEDWDEDAITAELELLLTPILEKETISGVVLGCTHFAFIQSYIEKLIPNEILFFEPSWGIIKQVENHEGLFSRDEQFFSDMDRLNFLSTDPTKTAELQEKYLNLRELLPDIDET
jgi:glutamate racemase